MEGAAGGMKRGGRDRRGTKGEREEEGVVVEPEQGCNGQLVGQGVVGTSAC